MSAFGVRCAGILLTGGASRRMGLDKATLHLVPGQPNLAVRAARVLAGVATPTVEVGPGVSGLEAVNDGGGHPGPLAAIGAGLAWLRGHGAADLAVVVLACDMPLVGPELLGAISSFASAGSVVPLAGAPRRAQPLCARWSAEAMAEVPALLEAGHRSLRPLLAHPDVRFLSEEEWLTWAGAAGAAALSDADTPADAERLRTILVRDPQDRAPS